MNNLTVTGAGTIDGQGAPWWTLINREKAAGKALSSRPGSDLPTATPHR